jgi:hypothetical protein
MNLKNVFTGKFAVLTAAAVATVPVLSAGPSLAALSTEEQAMVTAVTTKFTDIVGAISEMATANLGIAVAIVVGSLVIGYALRAGRG